MRTRMAYLAALNLILTMLAAAPVIAFASPPTQEEGTLEIATPAQGDVVRGVVQISGTALHPDFNHYVVEFGFNPNVDDQWFPVQNPVTQPVQDGALAFWDTTIVADGSYQLRLRVIHSDGTSSEVVSSGIEVANAISTATPTVFITAVPTSTPAQPTAGPTPTPLIQQPPTRTPRPTPTPGGPTLTPTPNPQSPINSGSLRLALCRGGAWSLAFFILLSLYVSVRHFARAEIRAWWIRFRRSKSGRGK